MLAATAIFQTLFLSPFLVVALVGAGIVLVIRGRRRPAGILLSVTALLLLAFSTRAVSTLVLRPLERSVPAFSDPVPGVNAIVVLGGGVRENDADQGGRATLTATAQTRLDYGFLLYRTLDLPVFVSGGRPWRGAGAVSEADVAADVLRRYGVPAERIVTEGRSATTWENARFLAPLLAARGIARVALVTSAMHMPRARIAFARAGIEAVPAPTDYLSRSGSLMVIDFLPTFNALHDSFLALEEYCGLVLYALRR